MKFYIGDEVRSVMIGSCHPFTGVVDDRIVDHCIDIDGKTVAISGYYHVRDSDGNVWHRTEKELELAS